MRYQPALCVLPWRVSIRQSSGASLRRMRETFTRNVCRVAANNSASSASASPQVARTSVSCDTHPLARCSTRRMRDSLGVNAVVMRHAPQAAIPTGQRMLQPRLAGSYSDLVMIALRPLGDAHEILE